MTIKFRTLSLTKLISCKMSLKVLRKLFSLVLMRYLEFKSYYMVTPANPLIKKNVLSITYVTIAREARQNDPTKCI